MKRKTSKTPTTTARRTKERRCRPAPCSTLWLDFNINDDVLVKLTPRGLKLHREEYDKLVASYKGNQPFEYRVPKTDRRGWSKWQMWHLMQTFGEHISMCLDPPFETTIKIGANGKLTHGGQRE